MSRMSGAMQSEEDGTPDDETQTVVAVGSTSVEEESDPTGTASEATRLKSLGKDPVPRNPAPFSDQYTRATQPPWVEWSDSFINYTSWGNDNPSKAHFEDSFTATELLGLKAYHWMRPSDLFQEPPAVVKLNSLTLDLITPNAHLCEKSETMRYILSEISELYDYSLQNKVECEGEGVAYVPNYGDDRRWTPWSHIYSCCKAGVKDEIPLYNPNGKYYVRLYFLGAWRRIVVDDRIPVLPSGRCGLPLTGLNELWPMLLTKALLKIATVTWKGSDVKRFSATSALTGWVFEWIDNIDGVNPEDLWTDLENILPKFKDPTRIPSWNTIMVNLELRKSEKKRKMEKGEAFWWMPPLSDQTSDLEDLTFRNNDSLERIMSPPPTNGEEQKIVEYKWKRKFGIVRHFTPPPLVVLSPEPLIPETVEGPSSDKPEAEGVPTVKRESEGEKKEELKDKPVEDVQSEKKPLTDLTKKGKKGKKKLGDQKVSTREMAKSSGVEEGVVVDDDKTVAEKKDKDKKISRKHKSKVKNMATSEDPSSSQPRQSNYYRSSTESKAPTEEERNFEEEQLNDEFEADDEEETTEMGSEEGELRTSLTTGGTRRSTRAPKKSRFRMAADMKLPSIPEILHAVQKYAGIEYRDMLKDWEGVCGKDAPVAVVVVLKCFPKPEDDGVPPVPSFLQHPIHLTEVRDTRLPKPSDRPPTPLWKRFRWKAWAMKKGLIPVEPDPAKVKIRAIKAKTPFTFKTDWYEFTENEEARHLDELAGEDGLYYQTEVIFGTKKLSPPNVPPTLPLVPLPPVPAPPPPSSTRLSKAETPTSPPTPQQTPPAREASVSTFKSMKSGRPASERPEESTEETLTPPPPSPRKSLAPTERRKTKVSKAAVSKAAANHQNQKDKHGHGHHSSHGSHAKRASTEGDKLETRGSQTVVLHEAHGVGGESEEDFFDGSKKVGPGPESLVPSFASATMWFKCDDIAKNLRKFCKFYASASTFGSCYILRRETGGDQIAIESPAFNYANSELPKYPEVITEYKQRPDSLNVNINFDRWKSYNVTNYHLDEKQGIDSGFYLFSDCWTDQEIIVSVVVIQEEFLKKFTAATRMHDDVLPVPPPTPNHFGTPGSPGIDPRFDDSLPDVKAFVNLNVIIEPWDWRKDCCLSKPVICTSIRDHWIGHIRLPAGRNTFRIWVMFQNPEALPKFRKQSSDGDLDEDHEFQRNSVPFTVRIVSQTPIFVGSRVEVQNYMTNPPMLFLKQCERVANCIWGLLACFGKQRHAYMQILKQLRRSYRPISASNSKLTSKRLRDTHDIFEELFVSLIAHLNDERLDRMMVLTLRVLFLNPKIGRQFSPKQFRRSADSRMYDELYRTMHQGGYFELVKSAILTIQRYYRGWRVRYLFQLRNKTHPKFRKIEHNVRKIGVLLAQETDSVYAHAKEFFSSLNGPEPILAFPAVDPNFTPDPDRVPPTIMPYPPHWAVDLMRYLMERNPLLVKIHPHAHCVSHCIKIQEIDGPLPQDVQHFAWYPFLREIIKVPSDSESCFCEIDLQACPQRGVYMNVVDNDTEKSLSLPNSRLFIGSLAPNKHGYTILCHRWTLSEPPEAEERPLKNLWKLRVIAPVTEEFPNFIQNDDELPNAESDFFLNEEETSRVALSEGRASMASAQSFKKNSSEIQKLGSIFPRKLSLRRLSGYYLPNEDFSLCRYVLETEEKRCTLSLRFQASYDKVKVRVQVWNYARRSLIFDETCEGGLVAPCIQLHISRRTAAAASPSDEDWARGDLLTASGLLNVDQVGSATSNMSTDGRKSSAGQMRARRKRRYVISVFIVDDSWPLSDRQWIYVLYKNRKFFKDLKLEKDAKRNCEMMRQELRAMREERERVQALQEEAGLEEVEELELEDEEEIETPEEHQSPAESPPPLTDSPVLEKEKDKPSLKEESAMPKKKNKSNTASHKKGGKDKPKDKEKGDPENTDKEKTETDETDKTKTEKDGRETGSGDADRVEGTGEERSETEEAETAKETLPTAMSSVTGGSKGKKVLKTKMKEWKWIASLTPSPDPSTVGTATNRESMSTAYPSTPPPSTVEGSGGADGQQLDGIDELESSKHKVTRLSNANLEMKHGGGGSEDVTNLDQPHWILEIVTDAQTKYKIKSSRQIFRKRFLESDEMEEFEENVKEFRFVEPPIHDMFECPDMDE